jgi:hypothetical protein
LDKSISRHDWYLWKRWINHPVMLDVWSSTEVTVVRVRL